MIIYEGANSTADLQQILELQKTNLPSNLSPNEQQAEGFVTVHHDLDLLAYMNSPYPHIVAKDGHHVVGYALVMLQGVQNRIPILQPMFERFENLLFQNLPLKDVPFFVMGQVCVKKSYRGSSVFSGLYQQMKTQMTPAFDCVVTQISKRNPRSIRAHQKVGFQNIMEYKTATDHWVIVLWDWS